MSTYIASRGCEISEFILNETPLQRLLRKFDAYNIIRFTGTYKGPLYLCVNKHNKSHLFPVLYDEDGARVENPEYREHYYTEDGREMQYERVVPTKTEEDEIYYSWITKQGWALYISDQDIRLLSPEEKRKMGIPLPA
jgi:hypothetical protein